MNFLGKSLGWLHAFAQNGSSQQPEVSRTEVQFLIDDSYPMRGVEAVITDNRADGFIIVTVRKTDPYEQELTLTPGLTRAEGWPQEDEIILPAGEEKQFSFGREMFSIRAIRNGQTGNISYVPF